jgi:hypothetical protein
VFSLELDYSKVKRILNIEDAIEFTKEFQANNQTSAMMGLLNWNKVKTKYYGIEIIPLLDIPITDLYKHRLMWYKTFDIPSGCIWDTKAIANYIKITI